MFDIKIANADIIAGNGRAAGDIAIKDGRVAKIATSIADAAKREIDAGGHAASAGFIDLHTHCSPGPVTNYLQQGVTTVVTGNCGFSAARCDGRVLGPNIATFIGHNSLRMAVIGSDDRDATPAEMDKMKRLIAAAMDAGAVGFSTGLAYVPGIYTSTEEVVELAKAAADFGGFYASHIRSEGDATLDALDEAFTVGRESGLSVQISHHKVAGKNNWGRSTETLDALARARAAGIDVTQDQYPYTACSARIGVLMPPWAREGDEEQFAKRFADSGCRAKIKQAVLDKLDAAFGSDLSRIVIATCPHDASLDGKSLAQIANERGGPALETAADFVIEMATTGMAWRDTMCVYHEMAEQDVARIMQDPFTAIGSDGWDTAFGKGKPHPRLYGAFPRVLGRYCREQKLFPLREAIRKMTLLPAQRLDMPDRGELREGACADVVVFDPDAIADTATFDEPHRYPVGIDYVIVNGAVAIDHGQDTGARAGEFLARE